MTYNREAEIAAKLQQHDSKHKQRSGQFGSPQLPALKQQTSKYPSKIKDLMFIALQLFEHCILTETNIFAHIPIQNFPSKQVL